MPVFILARGIFAGIPRYSHIVIWFYDDAIAHLWAGNFHQIQQKQVTPLCYTKNVRDLYLYLYVFNIHTQTHGHVYLLSFVKGINVWGSIECLGYTLSPIIMVQWKIAVFERANYYWRYTHFSLKHFCGRKDRQYLYSLRLGLSRPFSRTKFTLVNWRKMMIFR